MADTFIIPYTLGDTRGFGVEDEREWAQNVIRQVEAKNLPVFGVSGAPRGNDMEGDNDFGFGEDEGSNGLQDSRVQILAPRTWSSALAFLKSTFAAPGVLEPKSSSIGLCARIATMRNSLEGVLTTAMLKNDQRQAKVEESLNALHYAEQTDDVKESEFEDLPVRAMDQRARWISIYAQNLSVQK